MTFSVFDFLDVYTLEWKNFDTKEAHFIMNQKAIEWFEANGIPYDKFLDGIEFVVSDKDHAILFKLTWL